MLAIKSIKRGAIDKYKVRDRKKCNNNLNDPKTPRIFTFHASSPLQTDKNVLNEISVFFQKTVGIKLDSKKFFN